MPRRLRKILKRLLIVMVVLGVLGLIAFTWLFHWPFEGKVDDLLALVPEHNEFVIRADWDDLMASGWLDRNLEEAPAHPAMAEWVEGKGAFRGRNASSSLSGLRKRIADIEAQINDRIPLSASWATFGVEKDVLSGEVIASGVWCSGQNPRLGPPSHQELLILKRVSWRTRLISALEHEFVRDMISEDPTAPTIEALADGVFKLTLKDVRPSPERLRSGCGRGYVITPENVWFLKRIKDVLAICNSERMMLQVTELANDSTGTGSFAARPGFVIDYDPEGVAAAANLQPLSSYLIKAMENAKIDSSGPAAILDRFVRPRALQKLSGSLSLSSLNLLKAGASVAYTKQDAPDAHDNMYSLPARPVGEGLSTLVPAEDTFAAMSLRCKPEYLLNAIYEEALTRQQRQLWVSNFRKMRREGKTRYRAIEEFFAEIASRLGNTATVALARLSEVYDAYEYDEWFTGDADPMMAVAIMVKLADGADSDEVDAFLADRMGLLGMESELTKANHAGFTYTRMELAQRTLDFKHVKPAYIVVAGHVIFVNNHRYLHQILETVAEGSERSLSRDPTYRQTMAALPSDGHVGLFVDIEKLTRIPERAEPGAKPQGLLWDYRNLHVTEEHDYLLELDAVRARIEGRYPKPLSAADEQKAEAEIEAWVTNHQARYPEWVEDYRQSLESWRRIRSIGIVIGAEERQRDMVTEDVLDLRMVLSLRDPEPWVRWTR